MTDRAEYMREYMRAWRKKAREAKPIKGLSEERVRAIIREELELALRPFRAAAQLGPGVGQVGHRGDRGGTATAANGKTVSAAAVDNVNSVSSTEPIPYWRPGGQMEPRCQARSRDKSRCKARAELVVLALDGRRRRGEFASCKLHGDAARGEFRPHESVLSSWPD